MAGSTRKARKFEVLNSFNGLDKGDVFTADDAEALDWSKQHAETGYLRDVTEEDTDGRGADDKG